MSDRPTLDELALEHGTDKGESVHGFTAIYDELLAERRDAPVSVLEIGVYEGASLRMWRDYFPHGRVVGVDINESARDHAGDRVEIRVGDQANPHFLKGLAADGPFDLIVDDGGHLAHQQITSLRELWPLVKPGGLYVVEDIHTSYLERWGMGWRRPGTTVEFLKYLVDDTHAKLHGQPVTLPDLESICFRYELCVLRRAIDPGPAPAASSDQ